MLRSVLLLLAACLLLQGLAVSARRALGPGHFHLRTPAALSALQAEAAPRRYDSASLPFGGRLRSHPAPAYHSEVEHHSHGAGLIGVVTLGDDGPASPALAWGALARNALDLPALLSPARLPAPRTKRNSWPDADNAEFDSRSTPPPLRPPRR